MGVGFVCMHAYAYKTRGVWGHAPRYATERKSCTGVHEGHSTTAVQNLESVAVCHLVSTPFNISKLISGNAKKVNNKLNTVL